MLRDTVVKRRDQQRLRVLVEVRERVAGVHAGQDARAGSVRAQQPGVETSVEGDVAAQDDHDDGGGEPEHVGARQLAAVEREGEQREVEGAALHQHAAVEETAAQRLHLQRTERATRTNSYCYREWMEPTYNRRYPVHKQL